MKQNHSVACLLFLSLIVFSHSTAAKAHSGALGQRHLEVRVKPFIDLYFFIYKLASSSDKPPPIDGFAQAIEAARQVPLFTPLKDLILFNCDSAKAAERAFAQFPETDKLRTGEVIPIRQRLVHLAQTLAVIEPSFREKIWPQHKVAIQEAEKRIARDFVPQEEKLFRYFMGQLGMGGSDYVVPIYLVADGPWPAAFTAQGKLSAHGMCLVNVGALPGAKLFDAILHESIHALDAETRGEGNALIGLRSRLLKAGFDEHDRIVRDAPHMLVFIQSVETVRRFLDASYLPYTEGVFARPGIQPLVNIELPIWTAYLDGKLPREKALDQIVEAFVKAQRKEAAGKSQSTGSENKLTFPTLHVPLCLLVHSPLHAGVASV